MVHPPRRAAGEHDLAVHVDEPCPGEVGERIGDGERGTAEFALQLGASPGVDPVRPPTTYRDPPAPPAGMGT